MLGFLPNSYCKPGNFKYWRSAEAESGETGYFNSALSTERAGATVNAQLTIYLRLLLVKRGKEWHSPDRMILNSNMIVLVEPVNPTSRVAQLISQAKNQ